MIPFLPAHASTYRAAIETEAAAAGLDPCLVAAIGDRETLWGTSRDLDVLGPTGTGDRAPRDPSRWGSVLPPDGRGWGRGLMQIDWGSHASWCQQMLDGGGLAWEDPVHNIRQGCAILANLLRSFGGKAHPVPCAVAAYNAGPGRVFRVLGQLAGHPDDVDALVGALDAITTGNDYVLDVLARRDKFAGACLPR